MSNNTVRISVGGDFRVLYPEKTRISKELQDFFAQNDINALNFEAPVESGSSPVTKSGPVLSQPAESTQLLESWKINLLSLANNHIMDYGTDALYHSINRFEHAKTIGAGNWEKAYSMEVFTIHGKKIGFVALTQCEFGTLTDRWDNKNNTGAAWINHIQVDQLLAGYKKEVDALIVLAHAGVEYLEIPLPEWRDKYKQLISMGADAVIASHPHVPQGWEEYNGKPIFYSMGNFCFQTKTKITKPYWNNSLCVLLEFDEEMHLSYKVHNIQYDENSYTIDFCNNEQTNTYIESCLSYLKDDSLYISRVNKAVIELLPHYENLFKEGSNAIKCDGSPKSFLRFFKRSFFCKEKPAVLLNNLQCESHRWSIERAIKLLYNLS